MLAPLRGFWDTQSEFDRLFNSMVGDLFGRRGVQNATATRTTWAPKLEAYAKDGDLVLHYDLPGVGLEEVEITLDANVLTVSGERRKASTEERVSYYLNELPYGAFTRSVTVPEGVDAEGIKARFENGVLEVVLPGAAQEAQPKKIAIESGEGREGRTIDMEEG
jgi:HSP20 family protein